MGFYFYNAVFKTRTFGVNIFSPYIVNQHITGNSIEIELPLWRKRFYFITFRIFPFILLLLIFNVYITAKNELPNSLLVSLTIGVCLISVLMLLKKYVVKVSITKAGIELYRKKLGGTEVSFFAKNDIEKLIYSVQVGKSGGTFFYVKPNNKSKVEFITIPVLNMNDEATASIKNELKAVLGFDVERI